MGGIETLALLAVGGGLAERAARLLGHGICRLRGTRDGRGARPSAPSTTACARRSPRHCPWTRANG